MNKKTEKIFWNGEVIGLVIDPKVDNFDYYGEWKPVDEAGLYENFLEAVDEDGGAQVFIGEVESPLVGSVELEPDDEIEIKIRV